MAAALALAASYPAPAASAPEPAAEDGIAARAARLHRRAIVVDTHLDVPYTLDGRWADISKRGATPHYDIPRAREGGLTAGFFAVYVPARFAETGGAARKTLELIDMVHRLAGDHPRDLVLAVSVADIRRAKKEDRMALLMGIEGGHAIEDSLG
ncbi:MAG: membrane dipeptidase, partial [Candidatus Polarisedimenticolia bacterium]